jgi:membrane-associated phospholipid phosphatase
VEEIMAAILQMGISFIVAFQALGGWLLVPMQFFTFLGSQNFFMIILPALYWCINADLGIRIGTILLFSSGINDVFKLALRGPRPYWYSTLVKAFSTEKSFGVPSGHAQNAASIWGMLASRIKRPWAWPAAIALILLIGLSRLYLAVHFPHDVLLGWLIGSLVLWAFLRWWDTLAAWLKKQTLAMQVGLAFAASLLLLACGCLAFLSLQGWQMPAQWLENAVSAGVSELPAPVTLDDSLTSAGTLFGLLAGLAWIKSQGGFKTSGVVWQLVMRYILGVAGVVIFWYGPGAIFPRGDEISAYILRYLRYTLVGLWISAGAPYLFLHLNLAQRGD